MRHTKPELQSAMLRALAAASAGLPLLVAHGRFRDRTAAELGVESVDLHDFLQKIWSLVRQGLLYVRFHPIWAVDAPNAGPPEASRNSLVASDRY